VSGIQSIGKAAARLPLWSETEIMATNGAIVATATATRIR
jgi:hypothetical protein